MNASALKLLLEGVYICPVRSPDAFDILQDEDEQDRVNEWLEKINMRLERLGDEGAFFMAPAHIETSEINRFKAELQKFRDEYGPAVLFLDFIRQTDATRYCLSPGECIALYDLDALVSQSTMLEAQLKSLHGVISGASSRQTNYENLRRLLEHLAKDDYVQLESKSAGRYLVTGKVDQIYAVLQFLDENKVIPDAQVDDLESDGSELDLFGAATASGESAREHE